MGHEGERWRRDVIYMGATVLEVPMGSLKLHEGGAGYGSRAANSNAAASYIP